MNRMSFCVSLAISILLSLPLSVAQQSSQTAASILVPRLIRFSGAVKDDQGQPRSGVVGITFALYKDQEGGAALWLERQNVQADAQGRYTVLLGNTTNEGMPMDVFAAGEARWLGVLPEGQAEHRVLLVSVPYALKAADAETLGGMPASAFVLAQPTGAASEVLAPTVPAAAAAVHPAPTALPAPGPISGNGTPNQVAKFTTDNFHITDSTITEVGGNVGIGTPSPSRPLHILSPAPVIRLEDTHLPNSFWELQQSAFVFDTFGFVRYENSAAVEGKSFVVSNAGNLGIGTGSPQRKLHIRSSAPVIRLEDTTVPNSFWELQQSAFFVDTFGFVRYENNAAVAGKSFVVSSAGNVGIGTAAPAAKLEVAGNVKVSGAGSALVFPDGSIQTSATRTRGITFLAGSDTGPLLADTDSEKGIYVNVIGPMTFQSVTCYSDVGNPIINIQRNTGVAANILTANLTCSPAGATSTSFVAGQNVLNVNDVVDFAMVTAGGQAHRLTVAIKTLLN